MRRSTFSGSETPARPAHATNASTSLRYARRVASASEASERTKSSSSKPTPPRYLSGARKVLFHHQFTLAPGSLQVERQWSHGPQSAVSGGRRTDPRFHAPFARG